MQIKTEILNPKAVFFKTFMVEADTKAFISEHREYQTFPLPHTRTNLKKKPCNVIYFPDDIAMYDDSCLIIQVAKNLFISYSYSPISDFGILKLKHSNKSLTEAAKKFLGLNAIECHKVIGQIIEFNLIIK